VLVRHLGAGDVTGDIGGQCGQVRVGSRREHLADAEVELVLAEPTLNERGLKHVDRLLTVGP
jgi:hypothetical protein